MQNYIRSLLVPGLAALALAACGSDTTTLETASAAMDQKPKLELNVARLQIASSFEAPSGPSHIEDELPVSLNQRVIDWADKTLAPRGTEGVARFTVTDASIVETHLNDNAGISSPIRFPQTIRFDSTITATFEALDQAGKRIGQTVVESKMSRTMSTRESDEARAQVLDKLADAAVEKFDAEVKQALERYAGPYIM